MPLHHAHIYFELSEQARIHTLLTTLQARRPPLRFHQLYLKPVGPHALPMAELHFEARDRADALRWLDAHRDGLSVLIHADTGDDVRDHLQNIVWLGKTLPIDFDFFDLVQKHPELALHPKTAP